VILALIGLKLPWVLGLTFPMGTLLAMLIGYGRLSDESEAVALFAGGVPFMRVAAPAAALGLVASLAGFIINDKVTAEANSRVDTIQERVLHEPGETASAFNLEDRRQGVLRAMAHVEKGFDASTKSMRQVVITFYDGKSEDPALIVYAERGQWQSGQRWLLTNVSTLAPRTGLVGTLPQMSSDDLEVPILSKTPEDVSFLAGHLDTLDFHQLSRKIAALKASGAGSDPKLREAEVDLWSKLALPLASLVFALVGAPLGLRPVRSPKQTGWVLAVLIIFCY
jgi:lipopolysaccharide export system permease protein